MKKVLLCIGLILSIFTSVNVFAQSYEGMTENKMIELYKQSCETEQFANCYQLGLIYQKYPETVFEKSEEGAPKKTGAVLAKEYFRKACSGNEKEACKELDGKKVYEGASLLYYFGLILVGLAVFLISKTIFQDEDQFQAQEKLEDSKTQVDEIAKHGIILRYSRPFFKRYFSPIVSGMKSKKTFKEKYRRKLAAAGLTNILTPEDFFAFKLFLIVGFPILFMVIRTFLEETWPLQFIPLIALVGFFYPDFWIKGKIEKRQKEVIRAMPFCVDMLALSVEAGLDFIAAMAKVIEKAKANALTEEFEILIREIKIGASRAEALRNLAWRIDLIQISSFSATLIAADSVGASIGPILKALATEIRQKKSSEVEKAGATAATKILFPMLFLIVPSVLMIVFAPIVLEVINGK
ncbi:type II secretion system F family protein [Bacteriovorax sp. PP10]|uniref:Type II secretion system F family protein n=1 Tax=Bacteriovorax antarcticus TaxID=3088717 RepID=A0ABU5VTM9_9BACT|nr:type II secretion system F family protein [Bacteriovorax sp. PP10]MEA9355005.1 type II secretion system F family protein [Bacteriovorax sp. PP10]